ncbi:hypothetical protein PGTUg99_004436 [Puccinia graminis f. sp. tritici]|uniref:Uncharacterized protein n=1 Tax=Puccinia graminis f. sp. tritici TaxID=56615 RepID=A0A5B0PMY5_PUCGR|nr:hypothetical protein PGTUg99_004436 [Puccinia graminis f. sp. tritici]
MRYRSSCPDTVCCDTIPWVSDWVGDPIHPFSIPGIVQAIRSDKSADTGSDRICYIVDLSKTDISS